MWQIKHKAYQPAMFKRAGQQVTHHYIISQFPRIPETWEKQQMTGLIQRFALQQFSTNALVLNIAKGTTGPGDDRSWVG